jgi:predicted  nucleic acid-binding Zn-ribbon protein
MLALFVAIGVVLRKIANLHLRFALLEEKVEMLRDNLQELTEQVQKLDDKIDIIEEIEELVERIQVKREEDKDKIKQFLVRKFSDGLAG